MQQTGYGTADQRERDGGPGATFPSHTHYPGMPTLDGENSNLPSHRDPFHGEGWFAPRSGRCSDSRRPVRDEVLGQVADGGQEDADAVMVAARKSFEAWRDVVPLEHAKIMRQAAAKSRKHGDELALIDAADGGNPVNEMRSEASKGAGSFDFRGKLVTEIKAASIPLGPGVVNLAVQEPLGVVARIAAR